MKAADNLDMIKRLLVTALIAVSLLGSPALAARRHYPAPVAASASGTMQQFSTEAAAQAHCPSDTVVWLNTRSGIYHEKGMRWYGNTRQGAYVCRREADADGDRDTRNGQ